MTGQPKPAVPKLMMPVYEQVVCLTDRFCQAQLTEEYAALCRGLAAALARKRPSPLASGRLQTWACGIVHTLGSLNWLFDKSQPLYISASDLAAAFGVAPSTSSGKMRAIMDALRIKPYDHRWLLPSRIADHPFAWMIRVNGIHVDARLMPLEIQYEAEARGMIPPLP